MVLGVNIFTSIWLQTEVIPEPEAAPLASQEWDALASKDWDTLAGEDWE